MAFEIGKRFLWGIVDKRKPVAGIPGAYTLHMQHRREAHAIFWNWELGSFDTHLIEIQPDGSWTLGDMIERQIK